MNLVSIMIMRFFTAFETTWFPLVFFGVTNVWDDDNIFGIIKDKSTSYYLCSCDVLAELLLLFQKLDKSVLIDMGIS